MTKWIKILKMHADVIGPNISYPFRLYRLDSFGENPLLMHNASKADQIHEIL